MFPDNESRCAYVQGYKSRKQKLPDDSHNYTMGALKSWWLAGYRDYELENGL